MTTGDRHVLSPDLADTIAKRSLDTPPADDYEIVRRAIEFISENWREQPSLEQIAARRRR